MEVLQVEAGCDDFSTVFECDAMNQSCISCYAALMAATKRGFKVKEGLEKVRDFYESADKESSKRIEL